jgi:ATP-dependent protease ClpP protease subunit
MHDREQEGPSEIAIVGDLTEGESDVSERLLSIPPGGECTLYFDSPGGNPYGAVALTTIILVRELHATGIVTGECSSAALWPFAACSRRIVTRYSALLFHPMKWQSEEHVGLSEAAEWARHFGVLEGDMDELLGELFGLPAELIKKWMNPGRYFSGAEIVEAGLAEMLDLNELIKHRRSPPKRRGTNR